MEHRFHQKVSTDVDFLSDSLKGLLESVGIKDVKRIIKVTKVSFSFQIAYM